MVFNGKNLVVVLDFVAVANLKFPSIDEEEKYRIEEWKVNEKLKAHERSGRMNGLGDISRAWSMSVS
jgi:hypothetical protein